MKPLIFCPTLLILLFASGCGQKTAGERSEEIDNFADPAIRVYDKANDVKSQLEKSQQDKLDDMNEKGF